MTRKITPDEKKLWKLATKGVKVEGVELSDFVDDVGKVKVKITPVQDMLPPKRLPQKPVKELIPNVRNAMDTGNFEKLKKGKLQIEGRIDLHGMWVAEAHEAVRSFIMMSHAAGKRCVLVITGKGGIRGDGKIRAEFPRWLNDGDLRYLVLSFTQATIEHGGTGAFYVYLRK